MLRNFPAISTLVLALAGAGAAQQTPPVSLESILQRMHQAAEANRAHYRAYILTRDYRLFGRDKAKPASQVMAQINFAPPSTKEFRILQATGSAKGENVVRHILEDESQATASGKAPGALTTENYDFTYLGEGRYADRDCFILGLKPRRSEKSLVRGRAWVDKHTYLVRQIEGDMAKLPSWWLKSVHLTLDFGELDGMWIQQRTRAVAEVRIFGTHVLEARPVKFESGATVAVAKRLPRRSRADVALGAAVR